MRRVLGLGIANPLVRVVVWIAGCGSVSVAGALAGGVGLLALSLVLGGAWLARIVS